MQLLKVKAVLRVVEAVVQMKEPAVQVVEVVARVEGVSTSNQGGRGRSPGPESEDTGTGANNGNSGAGEPSGGESVDDEPQEIPEYLEQYDEVEIKAAIAFGERLCLKKASDWADMQQRCHTASIAIDCIKNDVDARELNEEDLPDWAEWVRLDEVKRLIHQGTLLTLPDSRRLLVRKETKAPDNPD